MRTLRTTGFLFFGLATMLFIARDHARQVRAENSDSERTGSWTIEKSDEAGKVEFGLISHRHHGNSTHESTWGMNSFTGIDFSKSGKQDVRFSINREAGKIECEGYLNNGEGAGMFHFFPDPNFPEAMRKIDFSVDEDKQYEMAIQDLTVEFARQMREEHLNGLDADKLIAFRIFGVDKKFIDDLRSSGIKAADSDKLVAFRIHGVTPQMVRSLRDVGYSPDEDTLVAMRIHGATPEWMQELKQRGYDHVDLQELIAFRIHGVSPEFIDKLKTLGYSHPDPQQLIAMRIHNVSPEYISDLRSHGMHDLSIDQLVSMRIHGID